MNNPNTRPCSFSHFSNFEENRGHLKLAPNMLYKAHRALQAVCYFILMFTESSECENISEMLSSSESGGIWMVWIFLSKDINNPGCPGSSQYRVYCSSSQKGAQPGPEGYFILPKPLSDVGERESLLGRRSFFQLRKCGGGSHLVFSIITELFSMDLFFFLYPMSLVFLLFPVNSSCRNLWS